MKTVPMPLITFVELRKTGSEMDADVVALVEGYIFEAWKLGLTGNYVKSYVCAMSNQPNFVVEPILDSLINRMAE